MALFVGTSGWAYGEWQGAFYPPSLPRRRFLEHYGRALTACEVNTTFYRLHSRSTIEGWAAAVPQGFRFAVKAHRRITHRKRVQLDEPTNAFLARFLDSLEPLDARLGCLLVQFPDFVERDDEALAGLLARLPAGLGFACEFRNPAWHDVAVAELLARRAGTVCVSESEGAVPRSLPPGPLAYVRLKADRYSDEARAGWLELLRGEARRRDVYVFAKHEGAPADAHAGVGLAQWLRGQISDQ